MTQQSLLAVFTLVLGVGFLASAAFSVLYPIVVPRRTLAGNHLLTFTIVIALMLGDQLLTLYWPAWGPSEAHALVLLLVFTGVSLAMLHRLALFLVNQVEWPSKAPKVKDPEHPVR